MNGKKPVSVIKWFENINNKRLYKFLQFDIKDFYPSIKETLNEAIQFAKEHVAITRKDVEYFTPKNQFYITTENLG